MKKLINFISKLFEFDLEEEGFERHPIAPSPSLQLQPITIVYVNSMLYKNQLSGCLRDGVIYIKKKNESTLWSMNINNLENNSEVFRPWIAVSSGTKLSFGDFDEKIRAGLKKGSNVSR